MRRLTLILCGIALAGAAASAVLFFLVGNSKQRLEQQLLAAEQHSTGLTASLAAAESTAAGQRERIQALDTQLAAAKRDLTATRVELEQRQRSLELAEARQAEAAAASHRAHEDLAAARRELTAARAELATALPAAEAQRYRETIAQLEDRTRELETALHTPAPTLVAGRGDHAQIVGVGPQNSFVVINFGRNHGAVPAQRLRITRGPDLLALVEISETRENYSIAQVLADSLSGQLRQGDAASLSP